jgi:hypothetical protein
MSGEARENMRSSTGIVSCVAEINLKWDMHQIYRGARGSVDGLGTILEARRLWL